MVIAPPRQPRARRRRPERRACPTPCVRALRWWGRRHGLRRAGEGHQASVDGLAWRIVELALLVFGGALLEALWTLRYLDQGGQEAHPLRAMALTYGPPRLLQLTIGLTRGGHWCLAAQHPCPLAQRGLHGLTRGAGVVLLAHRVLCVRLGVGLSAGEA